VKTYLGGYAMFKKLLIMTFLVFVLFGCSKTESTEPEDTPIVTKEPIVYESLYLLDTFIEVQLFQSLALSNLNHLRDFDIKTSMFDSTKTQALTLGQLRFNTSDSAFNQSFSDDKETYHVYRYFKLIQTKVYVAEYLVSDFTEYLTLDFIQDIEKLEMGDVTADFIFQKYGTHVVMAVQQGFEVEIDLLIQSRDLIREEYHYIRDILIEQRPLIFPIEDATFQLYENKSRIEMRLKTTANPDGFEKIINDFHSLELPIVNMIDRGGLLPIYQVFGYDHPLYTTGISLLKTRYQELFPA
jgi:hypothetical protein